MDKKFEKKSIILLFLILVVAIYLRLVNLNQSFWLDEAAQVIESARPLSSQLQIVADFHPPLTHLLLHFWMLFGRSEVWIRSLSVLLGVSSVAILYFIVKDKINKETALLSSLFLAISPYHIWYSQEARPYILFTFLSLFTTYFLIKKQWVLYTLSAISSIYALYFAPFMFLGHLSYIYLFEKKDLKKLLTSFLIVGITFLPWLPYFREQLSTGTNGAFSGWKGVVSVSWAKIIPSTFIKFALGKTSFIYKPNYIFLIIPFLLFIFCLKKLALTTNGKKILILFFVPLITVTLVNMVIPVAAPQRLLFLLPLFYVIYAFGILNCGKVVKYLGIGIIILISIFGVMDYYTNPYTQREQWKQAVNYIETNGDRNTMALFVFPGPFAPFSWYQHDKISSLGIAPDFIITDKDLESLKFKLSGFNRLYLFQYLTGLTDPGQKTGKFLVENNYILTQTKDFPGVGFVYQYDKR